MINKINENSNIRSIYKVGITGGIGSGKSTIVKEFNNLGIPVFYADDEAKKAYLLPDIKKKIVYTFGDVFDRDRINTKKLADIVFNNSKSLQKLNEIIHPFVEKKFLEWCLQLEKKHEICIVESAILLQTNLADKVNCVINVNTPEKIRINRVLKRDGVSLKKVKKRIENQMSDNSRNNLADYVIENYGDYDIKSQVQEILHDIQKKTNNLN